MNNLTFHYLSYRNNWRKTIIEERVLLMYLIYNRAFYIEDSKTGIILVDTRK